MPLPKPFEGRKGIWNSKERERERACRPAMLVTETNL